MDANIFNQYEFFNLQKESYILYLNFLLKNVYNIRIVENKKKRMGQTEFREGIIKKFNNCCIITGNDCLDELTAAHVIPVHDSENYDIDNGLLLSENLHRTFDKYKWAVNPDTCKIEINQNENVGSIIKYANTELNLDISPELYTNLKHHYRNFLKKIK